MLIATFGMKKIKSAALTVVMGAILGGSVLFFSLLSERGAVYLTDYADRVGFIESCGFTTDGEEIEVPTVIPTEWNVTYESYNSIQKSQGLDLDGYRGKTVTRYIYNINDFPYTATLVTGEDGRLIACDISENEAGGEIYTLIDGK